SPPGGQAFTHLRNPSFPLPLYCQRPAPQDLLLRQPLRKTVLTRHGHGRLGLRLRGWPLAAKLMDPGYPVYGACEGKRMSQLLGQPQCLLLMAQCLVRIAPHPESPGRIALAAPPRVVPTIAQVGMVLLGGVVRDALGESRLGWGQFAEPEQRGPQRMAGLYEQHGLLPARGQRQELLPQLPCCLQLPPSCIKPPQPPECWEELRGLFHLLA